jgi:hypothetical protein
MTIALPMFKLRRNEGREEKPEEIGSEPSFALFVSSWFESIFAVPDLEQRIK